MFKKRACISLCSVLFTSHLMAQKVDNNSLLEAPPIAYGKKSKNVPPPPRINKIATNTGGKDTKALDNAFDYLHLYEKRDKIEKVIYKDRRIMDAFNEQDNLIVSMYKQNKNMRDMDSITMTSSTPQILLLPDSVTITNAYAFPNTINITFQHNRLDLIASAGLTKSTVVVTYLEGNNIKVFTLNVKKPLNIKKSFIYPLIAYKYNETLSPMEVIERYNEVYRRDPKHGSLIKINGTTYIFYKDRVNGYINFGRGLYRMEVQNFNTK